MVQRINIRSNHGPHGNNHKQGFKNIDNGVRFPAGTIDVAENISLIDTVAIATTGFRT